MEIKDLTRAEEQIMQVLWQLQKGLCKRCIRCFARAQTGI
jgi:predicted transcriptional regulator